MPNTTKGYPYPEDTDPADVPADVQLLAEAVDAAPGIASLTQAQINALGVAAKWAGRIVWNQTTGKLQRCDGSTWVDLVLTNDGRLTDARTPTAHAATHLPGGGDEIQFGPTLTVVAATSDAELIVRSDDTVGSDADAKLTLDAGSGGEAEVVMGYQGDMKAGVAWREADDELRIDSTDAIDLWTAGGSTLRLEGSGDAVLYGDLTFNNSGTPVGLTDALAAKLTTPPAWTTHTPTVTSGTGSITAYTVNSAAHIQIGKIVHYRFDVTITTPGSAGGSLNITVPVASRNVVQISGGGRELAVVGYGITVGFDSAGSSTINVRKYDATTIIGTNHRIIGGITYEAA